MLGELHDDSTVAIDLVACPECGSPADVAWRADVASSCASAQLAKVFCAARHWFLMPTDQLQPI